MSFNEATKQDIIKRSRQNQRYSVPTDIKHYNFISIITDGYPKIQFVDMRQYLHLFAGVGLENLKQFLQHVLYRCGAHVLYDMSDAQTYQLLLEMANDIVFKSWLTKLFKEFDIQTILEKDALDNYDESMQDLIYKYGEVIVRTLINNYGFDDLQILFLLKDIAYQYLKCITGQISEYNFFIFISNVHQLVQYKTAFKYSVNKVNIPNTNGGFYYEFDYEYIMCRDFEKLMDQCQEECQEQCQEQKLMITTNDQETQMD